MIRVFGYTIVVQEDSLAKIDPNDIEFTECDGNICSLYLSNWADVEDNINALEECGLMIGCDFVVYSCNDNVFKDEFYNDSECKWLKEEEDGLSFVE